MEMQAGLGFSETPGWLACSLLPEFRFCINFRISAIVFKKKKSAHARFSLVSNNLIVLSIALVDSPVCGGDFCRPQENV